MRWRRVFQFTEKRVLPSQIFQTRDEATAPILDYIEFYNRKRRHQARWIILVRFTMNGPLLRHFLPVNSGRPRISFVRSPARVLKADCVENASRVKLA